MREFWQNLRRLNRYIQVPWTLLRVSIVLMAVNSLLSGFSLTTIGPLLDRVFNKTSFELPATLPGFLQSLLSGLVFTINRLEPLVFLRNVLIILVVVFLIRSLFMYQEVYLTNKFSLQIMKHLRVRIFEKYLLVPISESQKKRVGERLSHFTYDISLLNGALSSYLPKLIFNTFQTVVYFSILILINWRLTLFTIFIFPAFAWPLFKIGRRIRKLTTESQVSIGRLNSLIQEGLVNLPVVKAFVAEKREKGRFETENQNFFKISLKSVRRYAALSQIIEIIVMIAGVLLVYLGAREVVAGVLKSGSFLVFIAALFSLFAPLKTVVNNLGNLQQASAVFPRVYGVLEEKEEEDTGKKVLPGLHSGIRFDAVSFGYSKRTVLNSVSFSLSKGKRLGVVGESGVGKTTLINLILRFYHPSQGRITVDGVPISECTLSSYRKIFGLVTQEPLLFNDTVANNITYGKPGAAMEEVIRAAQIANIHSFIASLSNGYQTVIGERGVLLSGGERQRLALARAVLTNPEVLLLDEATSNLDSESERLLQEALDKVMVGRTCLVIAHRISTLQNSDWIIVLEKGKIVEEGTHADLMTRQGRYYYFYTLQKSSSKPV